MRRFWFTLMTLAVLVLGATAGIAKPNRVEGPAADPTCFDGKDNDRDGLIDYEDFDCFIVDYAVSGVVFEDTNSNGSFDDGEPRLSNSTVHLLSSSGFHDHLVTETDGSYFNFVGPSSYLICLDLPEDWIQTYPSDDGADCSGHAAGVAGWGHLVEIGTSTSSDAYGWSFGIHRGSCLQGGATGDETVGYSLLGVTEESGPYSSQVHELEGSVSSAEVRAALHEAGCAVAAVEGLSE